MEDTSFSMIPKKVLLTGFAPFAGLANNPSWDGVDAITKEEVEMKHNIVLAKEQIQVLYTHVDESVPKLWEEFQPDLTIHVGVSHQTDCLVLETQAKKSGYKVGDVKNKCPPGNQCIANGPEQIETRLNVHELCQEFNTEPPMGDLQIKVSDCAGNYLCEYLYYTSLCQDPSKTLFIHVPMKYTTDQIARALVITIADHSKDWNYPEAKRPRDIHSDEATLAKRNVLVQDPFSAATSPRASCQPKHMRLHELMFDKTGQFNGDSAL
ncbi:unnamed protein product [Chrysodeixis includens]|uniref:Pyroglutamyl-peptidase I n=1 Tax=Chrysodeixis includens TaxID=689277 RepID=A0A9P0FVK2_CHRIL|nr:unnamed protein product [Chrysodeixis includens]